MEIKTKLNKWDIIKDSSLGYSDSKALTVRPWFAMKIHWTSWPQNSHSHARGRLCVRTVEIRKKSGIQKTFSKAEENTGMSQSLLSFLFVCLFFVPGVNFKIKESDEDPVRWRSLF